MGGGPLESSRSAKIISVNHSRKPALNCEDEAVLLKQGLTGKEYDDARDSESCVQGGCKNIIILPKKDAISMKPS